MIFDNIENAKLYEKLNEKFEKAFNFLKNTDLKNIEDGKYEIQNDEIYANIQSLKTKPQEEKRFEVHRKYIDIQYVIKGKEKMGYGLLKDFSEIEEKYDDNKDVEFLKGEKFNFVDVEEGNFVIFYPQDVHAPMLAVDKPEEIKKVIVKILI